MKQQNLTSDDRKQVQREPIKQGSANQQIQKDVINGRQTGEGTLESGNEEGETIRKADVSQIGEPVEPQNTDEKGTQVNANQNMERIH